MQPPPPHTQVLAFYCWCSPHHHTHKCWPFTADAAPTTTHTSAGLLLLMQPPPPHTQVLAFYCWCSPHHHTHKCWPFTADAAPWILKGCCPLTSLPPPPPHPPPNQKTDFCSKMDSRESHFDVSLIVRDCVRETQYLKRKGELKWENGTHQHLLPNLTLPTEPNSKSGSSDLHPPTPPPHCPCLASHGISPRLQLPCKQLPHTVPNVTLRIFQVVSLETPHLAE